MKVIETIGVSSYSPGDVVTIPESGVSGEVVACLTHQTVPAVKMVIGETDRWGSEVTTMCAECFEKHEKSVAENPDQYKRHCEQCSSTDNVRAKRDPDEGMAGPVYMWCKTCREVFDKNYAEHYNPDTDHDSEYDYYR